MKSDVIRSIILNAIPPAFFLSHNNYNDRNYLVFNPFSAVTVLTRQNMTSVEGPRAERIKVFIMVVDP